MGVTMLPVQIAAMARSGLLARQIDLPRRPHRAGWNKIAAANVQTSDNASNLCPDVWRTNGYET